MKARSSIPIVITKGNKKQTRSVIGELKNNTERVPRNRSPSLNFSLSLRPEELFDQNRTFPYHKNDGQRQWCFLEKNTRKNSRQQQKMWCQMSVFARTHLVSVSHGRLPRSSLVACQGCQLSLLPDWWSFPTFRIINFSCIYILVESFPFYIKYHSF